MGGMLPVAVGKRVGERASHLSHEFIERLLVVVQIGAPTKFRGHAFQQRIKGGEIIFGSAVQRAITGGPFQKPPGPQLRWMFLLATLLLKLLGSGDQPFVITKLEVKLGLVDDGISDVNRDCG